MTPNLTLIRILKSLGLDGQFELCEGDTINIIGPNGSGKTILIEEMIGVREGHHVHRKNNLVCGYVSQVSYKISTTVGKFIDQIAYMQNISDTSKKSVIKALGLTPLLEQSHISTSSGEKKRILLACALMQKPDVLILDEFFQNIDSDLQKQFVELFQNLHAKNPKLAFVVISHLNEMPKDFFNKFIVLKKEN